MLLSKKKFIFFPWAQIIHISFIFPILSTFGSITVKYQVPYPLKSRGKIIIPSIFILKHLDVRWGDKFLTYW
jgi:hypothetical protein